MSVTYFGYLCYSHDALNDREPEIKFEPPESWKYDLVLPIQFSVLHGWTEKDKALYKDMK